MWDMTLTIEPNDQPQWWVDSSYSVHPDTKSHTGIFMTIGKCSMYTSSWKQKLNTKSSTEAELVAIDDAMAQILLTRHFLAAQGVPIPTTKIYQDSKSTILLSENVAFFRMHEWIINLPSTNMATGVKWHKVPMIKNWWTSKQNQLKKRKRREKTQEKKQTSS